MMFGRRKMGNELRKENGELRKGEVEWIRIDV